MDEPLDFYLDRELTAADHAALECEIDRLVERVGRGVNIVSIDAGIAERAAKFLRAKGYRFYCSAIYKPTFIT